MQDRMSKYSIARHFWDTRFSKGRVIFLYACISGVSKHIQRVSGQRDQNKFLSSAARKAHFYLHKRPIPFRLCLGPHLDESVRTDYWFKLRVLCWRSLSKYHNGIDPLIKQRQIYYTCARSGILKPSRKPGKYYPFETIFSFDRIISAKPVYAWI